MDSKTKALAITRAASGKKALDIITIDMRKVPTVCDWFVIASGTSTTQVRAIADNIEKTLKEKGHRLRHAEGEKEALWLLLDYGDVVVHLFYEDTRRFYSLESLWADMPQTRFKEKISSKKKSKTTRKKKRPTRSKDASWRNRK